MVSEGQSLRLLEKLQVLWIGAGIAGLDVVNAEFIKCADNVQFVLKREGDSLRLRPIPQCAVQKGDVLDGNSVSCCFVHDFRINFFMK